MRNNKRRIVLTHARVNFSQSETSSLLRGGGGGGRRRELNFELPLWRGVIRKDPITVCSLIQNRQFSPTSKLAVLSHFRNRLICLVSKIGGFVSFKIGCFVLPHYQHLIFLELLIGFICSVSL